jgi:HlyD family secretion protein
LSHRVWFALLSVLLIGLAAYYWVQQRDASSQTSYRTEVLAIGNVASKITATGSLQAVTKISVGSEVSGRVIGLYVDYNSKVRKGQLLATLDPTLFQAQVDQQRASLQDAQAAYENSLAAHDNAATAIPRSQANILGAQAQVDSARAQLSNSGSAIATAQANVLRGQAQLDNSQRFSERQRQLVGRDLIAKSEYDQARSTGLQDQASVVSLKSQLEGLKASQLAAKSTVLARQSDVGVAYTNRDSALAQVSVAGAQTRSAAARVSQAQASLAQAQYNLSRSELRAPISGVVLDRKVTIGQTVAAQFQAPDLFTLAENLEQMQVEVAVDEADIGQAKVGAKASFTVDSFPREKFTGTVREIRQAPVTLQNVVTYTVVIRAANPKLLLMPGMTATVSIEVASRTDALLASNTALRFSPSTETASNKSAKRSGSTLYTVDGKNLVPHSVKFGVSDGRFTELLETDLKKGSEVVVEAVTGNITVKATSTPRTGRKLF